MSELQTIAPKPSEETTRAFGDIEYDLRLYIAGMSAISRRAIENLMLICEAHLLGKHTLEVVDLMQQPELAEADQIVAIPTLVRRLPKPVKKILGDLSNTERLLSGLDIVLTDHN